MNIHIQAANPFDYSGGKKAVKFEGIDESNNAPIKGTFWGHRLQGELRPGTRISVVEDNGISWKEYKGVNEMSVSFKANVTLLSQAGGSTPAPAQQAPAHTTTGPAATSSGNWQAVAARAAEVTAGYVRELETNHFSREEAIQIATGAHNLFPTYFFGEKGC